MRRHHHEQRHLTIEVQNAAAAVDDSQVRGREPDNVAAAALACSPTTATDGERCWPAVGQRYVGLVTDGIHLRSNAGFTGTETHHTISDGTEQRATDHHCRTLRRWHRRQHGATRARPLTIAAAAGLLANDSDGDGDALSVLSFSAAANGTLNVVTDGASPTLNPGHRYRNDHLRSASSTTTSSGNLDHRGAERWQSMTATRCSDDRRGCQPARQRQRRHILRVLASRLERYAVVDSGFRDDLYDQRRNPTAGN